LTGMSRFPLLLPNVRFGDTLFSIFTAPFTSAFITLPQLQTYSPLYLRFDLSTLLYIIVCDIPKLGGRIGQVAYYYLLFFLWDLVVLLLPWLLPPLHLLLFGLYFYYMLFFLQNGICNSSPTYRDGSLLALICDK
ncbi:MAG: hypothetical protein PWR14_920, partial [Thermosediminibacterales bacterium]|nr:hypothetical protein [Thermosediminibacterales bacterium]